MKTFIVNRLMPGFLVRWFARPYVSGDSLEKGLECARMLWSTKRIMSTIDLLGEELTAKKEVEKVVRIYLDIIETIKKEKFASISVKPSAFGVRISQDYCLENFRRLLSEAAKVNVQVTMDMESSAYTDATLSMYRRLKPEFANFGTVLQSRLFRTKNDIKELQGLNAHIRLCIGIYLEKSDIAYTKKKIMKEKLVEYFQELQDGGHYVAIATHDEKTIERVVGIIEEKGIPSSNFEFQMLLGVPRREIQENLIEKGYVVRLYVPFATHWGAAVAYLKRRLIENPHMAIYTLRNIFGRLSF
ncbi:MAG: proline dehydrogenase family protein [Candidatus Heimdallarchaeota archaeon]